jgi:membrane associated rhomboid family serine protease
MLTLDPGVVRCPACDMTVLDPTDPALADAVDEAKQLHELRGAKAWMMYAVVAVAPVGAGAYAVWSRNMGGFSSMMYMAALVAGGVITLLARYGDRRWRHIPEPTSLHVRYATTATAIAAMLCVACGVVELFTGVDALAYQRGDELTAPWKLITSTFAHGGPMHLAGNLVGLFAFGIAVDLRIGRAWTAVVLAVSALCGALVQSRFIDDGMVGFSAAVFGLFGATLALMPARKTLLTISGLSVPMPTWAWMLIVMPLLTAMAWADTHQSVGWIAHLAGFVAGFVVALPLRRRPPSPQFVELEARRARRIDAVV